MAKVGNDTTKKINFGKKKIGKYKKSYNKHDRTSSSRKSYVGQGR